MNDTYWMRRALALARRGLGTTAPNPMVGAIVLDPSGNFHGEGYHALAGGPHAEVVALNQAGYHAKGGTLFVTLEPCCVQGRTPPCTNKILKSGIRKVVIGTIDPNPSVNGKGVEQLRASGVEVITEVLLETADQLIEGFRSWITHRRPFVVAKSAISRDGKIGAQGIRVKLTGPIADRRTMKLRAEAGAVLVGGNTVAVDDPELTVRGKFSDRRPLRIVVDGPLQTSPDARIFKTPGGPIWIVCDKNELASTRAKKLQKVGAKLHGLPSDENHRFQISDLLQKLGEHEITNVLVEGGADLLRQFAEEKWIDRWVLFRSPRDLGQTFEGRPTIAFDPESLFGLNRQRVIQRGDDLQIVAIRPS
jgi:diaminohydroxyphosphoribosylaminopyrimidine deaminase / 5-amino-6-(5-phosphoribosylamino)uracil reductase